MLAIEGRVVTEHDGVAAGGFDLEECLLKPGKLATRVVALAPHMEVEHVTTVGVVCNHFRASWESFTIVEC